MRSGPALFSIDERRCGRRRIKHSSLRILLEILAVAVLPSIVVVEETICRGRLYDVTVDNSRVPEVESKKSELVVCLFKPKRRVRAGHSALER